MHVVHRPDLRRLMNVSNPITAKPTKAVNEVGSGTTEFSVPFISLVPKALKPLRYLPLLVTLVKLELESKREI